MLAPFALRGHTAPLLLRIARHVLLVLRELLKLLLALASVPALLALVAFSLPALVLQIAALVQWVTSVVLSLPRVRPALLGPWVSPASQPLHALLNLLHVTTVWRGFGLLRHRLSAMPALLVPKERTI